MIAALRGGSVRATALFAEELQRHPTRLIPLDLHMEKPETFETARRILDERLGGKLDALVNNAGYGLFGSLEDLSEAQLRHQMEVNFFGPALLTRALLPALRKARGRVINVSSIAGLHAFPLYTAYHASKFALEGLTEALVYELKPHGVQVALIEPGGFSTEFAKGSRVFGATSFAPSSHYLQRSEALSHFLTSNVKRLGNPERVSRLIVKSVERRWLPLRMMIGIDAWAMRTLGWLTPGWFKLGVIDRMFRFMIFKD